jgi:Rps23 Pro-64 3,4-dihydroxylase Tpa1-like proline 4-hydroxylase
MKEIFKNYILEKLEANKENHKKNWYKKNIIPTKYLVIDNVLPEKYCEKIFNEFPINKNNFVKFNSFREKKKTSSLIKKYNPIISGIFDAIQDTTVVKQISEITNLNNLEPDPSSYAGGLSMMSKGDFLNPHIDNSHDRDKKRYRKLNLLYYVTPDWKDDFGGNFELWNEKVNKRQEIISKFNRLVIMETNKQSWHSVNTVIADKIRCCVSNYYFSPISSYKKDYHHVTSFTGRPNEKFKRFYGSFDNFIRNKISKFF